MHYIIRFAMLTALVSAPTSIAVPAQAPATLNVPAQYPTIQSAINAAMPGDTVLVAPGIYYESLIDFLGKAITVISSQGAPATVINANGSGYSVVRFISNEGPNSVLSGFTITGGQGNAGPGAPNPGAIGCGGGIVCLTSSSPTITNCVITGNSAFYFGGGVYSGQSASPTLVHCTITGNTASAGFNAGGGICVNQPGAAVVVTNCIVWGNTQANGVTDIDSVGSAQPPVVTSSNVGGGFPGVGNTNVDPMFVSPATGDFHLSANSPCIDAGDNTAPNLPAIDFEGDNRLIGVAVDMGADEYLALSPFNYTASLAANGSLTLGLSQGQPLASYFMFHSVAQLNATSPGTGFLFGLHISIPDFASQAAAGMSGNAIFGGMLDVNGASSTTIPSGGLTSLSGQTLWGVAVQLNPSTTYIYEPSNIATITFP